MVVQIIIAVLKVVNKSSVFTTWSIIRYLFLISLYTLITVSYLGYKKELQRSRVWANKLSVERDIGLELHLRSIENKLQLDATNRGIMQMEIPNEARIILENRLEELYFKGVSQKYEIKLTLCRPNDMLQVPSLYSSGVKYDDCQLYYNRIIYRGTPLADISNFYFLNIYDGRVSYLGVVIYTTLFGHIRLYIEFDSRYS